MWHFSTLESNEIGRVNCCIAVVLHGGDGWWRDTLNLDHFFFSCMIKTLNLRKCNPNVVFQHVRWYMVHIHMS